MKRIILVASLCLASMAFAQPRRGGGGHRGGMGAGVVQQVRQNLISLTQLASQAEELGRQSRFMAMDAYQLQQTKQQLQSLLTQVAQLAGQTHQAVGQIQRRRTPYEQLKCLNLSAYQVTPRGSYGFIFYTQGQFPVQADNMQGAWSTVRLFEIQGNAVRELGPGHAGHNDISNYGQGRFSHWNQGEFYMSTSDYSDPRTNGRQYHACWE